MKKYTEIYLNAFDYDNTDNNSYFPSEISEKRAVDIHHIIGRGKGGEDRIENLMAVTRQEHQDYGEKKDYMVLLLKIHRRTLEINKIEFENKWFEFYINMYENKTALEGWK
jgi:beta-galactosidase beta subunit